MNEKLTQIYPTANFKDTAATLIFKMGGKYYYDKEKTAEIPKSKMFELFNNDKLMVVDGNGKHTEVISCTPDGTIKEAGNGGGGGGEDGVGIDDIRKTDTSGLIDTYTITLTDGTTKNFTVTNGKDGTNGTNGTDGTNGMDGDDGVGIVDIKKTDTLGLVDVYTITLSDGRTKTFTVTNGRDGESATPEETMTYGEIMNRLNGGDI